LRESKKNIDRKSWTRRHAVTSYRIVSNNVEKDFELNNGKDVKDFEEDDKMGAIN